MLAAHVEQVMANLKDTKKSASEEAASITRDPKKKPAYLTERTREETRKMMETGVFTDATASHFLALHDELHSKIYGVPDPDLVGGSVRGARSQAQSIVEALGVARTVDFVRWAWLDEQRRETWRRENHRDGARMSAARLFSRAKLTEYRISLSRRAKNGG